MVSWHTGQKFFRWQANYVNRKFHFLLEPPFSRWHATHVKWYYQFLLAPTVFPLACHSWKMVITSFYWHLPFFRWHATHVKWYYQFLLAPTVFPLACHSCKMVITSFYWHLPFASRYSFPVVFARSYTHTTHDSQLHNHSYKNGRCQ